MENGKRISSEGRLSKKETEIISVKLGKQSKFGQSHMQLFVLPVSKAGFGPAQNGLVIFLLRRHPRQCPEKNPFS